MLVWVLLGTTILFALVAVYFCYRFEKAEKEIEKEDHESKKLEKTREDFTNTIVHELRSPASAIRGAAKLLEEGSLEGSEKKKMMAVISSSAEDLLATINELLEASQMQQGKLTIKKINSDLEKVAKEHIEIFSYAAKEKGVEITFEKEGEIPQFLFDPGRVGEVFNNLISNSLKFTNEGGKIAIKISRQDGQIEASVSDSGIGIPEDKMKHLFTKFGQIEGNLNIFMQKEGSSGLGLFISKQIIESHGGSIHMESKEGKGTKVIFTLPFEKHKD